MSIYGIFVVETKYYSGWVFGNEFATYWKKFIFQNKYKFLNPIQQNQIHINVLKKLLFNHQYIPYYNIVVFVGEDVELKKIMSSTPVLYEWQIIGYIQKFQKPVLSLESMLNIVHRIEKFNKIDPKSHPEHIKKVRQEYK